MVTLTAADRLQREPLIVLSEPIAEAGLCILRAAGRVHIAHETDPGRLLPHLAGASALVVRSSPVPAALLHKTPGLRVVGRHGAGLDNIDLVAARRQGVAVVHTPAANAASVAEFVLLAALALGRRLLPARDALARGALHDRGSLPGAVVGAGLVGSMLSGRTVGLVGLGAIGQRVAHLAHGVGASVIATDPALTHPPEHVELADLAMVLSRSDVLSLHVPLVPATTRLIDAAALARLPRGALLVNTARGGVVDSPAVLAALDSGALGGYAVDVYDLEPPERDDPLLHHPRVLASPHMAAMTVDGLDAMARSVADGVTAVLTGRVPPTLAPPRRHPRRRP
ncbi:NAD(P)-dependent oxidoreductase [Ornithinimicrobium sufpigmenti]|uniref:NAD(P)-dependent oxidoreductase n=1 Tax=Ornithinimicrobium sufpigmenti TaxID=2508882 RepID=UPI0010369E58|nr:MULTISPECIES: NAD(P)-dependent oxidoreductase [unclassified Ornithinimicrobium]